MINPVVTFPVYVPSDSSFYHEDQSRSNMYGSIYKYAFYVSIIAEVVNFYENVILTT